ncbi:hypothetical protein Tco_0998646, partial [Tanacetum coccineum]
MQMLYCFVNNIHVDNVELLWEGLHYALKNPSTQIPYPRFTKLIVGHYMTAFPEISQRARDKYHNLEGDAMVKNIFNSGKHKDGVGIKIPSWMITDEMKLTDHYWMYAVADDIIFQDTLQLSLAEQKSHEELEAKENEERVKEHLMVEEIDKLVEGTKNAENVEVELAAAEQPVNVNEEEEESTEDDYELKQREKEKHVEESRSTPSPTIIRSPRIYSTLISSDTEKRQELTVNAPPPSSLTPSSSSSKISATNSLLSLLKPKTGCFKRYKSFFDELQGTYEIMQESLPKMVDDRIKEFTKKQVSLYVAQGLIMERENSHADVAKMITDAIHQECENLRYEISSKINNAITNHIPSQIDSSVRNYMSGYILHVHPTQATPTSTREQQHQLYLTMKDNLQLKQDDLPIWLALKYKFERLQVDTTPCRPS